MGFLVYWNLYTSRKMSVKSNMKGSTNKIFNKNINRYLKNSKEGCKKEYGVKDTVSRELNNEKRE